MKLYYDKKSKNPTYFIQKGLREDGKPTTRNICRLGKHSELLKITPDPLAYAKEQVRIYNEEEKKNKELPLNIVIDLKQKIQSSDEMVCKSTYVNIGYLFLQAIYQKLEITKFFKEITKNRKLKFNPDIVNRFTTFSRILEPASKLKSHYNNYKYFEKPDYSYEDILKTMDLLVDNYSEYLEHIFKHSHSVVQRDTSVCYCDYSNFYCEIEYPDNDYVDEVTGEFIPGFRKYGFSKDHKPNPIVGMGLFMDKDGIPLSMCITPGDENEQKSVLPLEKELIKMLDGKKFVYCADAGLGSYHIRNFNSMGGKAFVITQSIKKLSKVLQQAVFNDCDYRLLSNGKRVSLEKMKSFNKFSKANINLYNDRVYKIINADKAYDLGLYEEVFDSSGKKVKRKINSTLKQKIVITFSRKTMEYQREIRNRQIQRAKNMLGTIDPQTYKKGNNDVTRFIKRKVDKTGKNKFLDEFELDEQRIKYEEQFDGFYAIATNLDDDAKTIISINEGRYKIEECFRLMKTQLKSRPIYHQNKKRIIAHFMICYTALMIYRLLEKLLDEKCKHFTARDVIETLNNMNVQLFQGIFYEAVFTDSKIVQALNQVFELGLDKQIYEKTALIRKIKKLTK